MNLIDRFEGEYEFLSNFYVEESGMTLEHYYQAAKTTDPEWVRKILGADTPNLAKKLGQLCPLRPDWEDVKLEVMEELLLGKFEPDTELTEKLLATGSAHLVEGNWWGDTYWGVCRGEGENHLGHLLMEVRAMLQRERWRKPIEDLKANGRI